MGGTTPEQVVLRGIRKVEEKAIGWSPMGSVSVPVSSYLLESLTCLLLMMDCNLQTTPTPPKLLVVMAFYHSHRNQTRILPLILFY